MSNIINYEKSNSLSLSLSLSNRLKNRFGSCTSPSSHTNRGFTIVELLVVIVVIGILAAITIVAYTGISSRAVTASVQSDLSNASTQLKTFYATNGAYPTANNCPSPGTTEICLKPSSGNTFTYNPINTTNPQAFHLTSLNTNGTTYLISDNSAPYTAISCPSGFIVVPGNSTYGTNDFCVMKYAASQVGSSTTPISQSGTTPWVNISQTTAAADSPNVAGCTGCHLITEGEYLTIVQNVLTVPSNWSSGTVGSGYIYSGHNDNAPANALAADSSDSNGYAGETNTGGNQRRTLTLTNGQVIWDMAGNVWEWTSGTSTTGQPGITGEGGYAWKEWSAATAAGTLSPNVFPSGTGISGASSWNSSKGIGQLYSYAGEAGLRGFLRGGNWGGGGYAGVLALLLSSGPGSTGTYIGFRVSR